MKKIGNWLKNHFIISCIVSGFIGAIIAWGLNWILISPPVKVGNLPQKELCIRRSPAAAGAVVNGSSAVTAAAV